MASSNDNGNNGSSSSSVDNNLPSSDFKMTLFREFEWTFAKKIQPGNLLNLLNCEDLANCDCREGIQAIFAAGSSEGDFRHINPILEYMKTN